MPVALQFKVKDDLAIATTFSSANTKLLFSETDRFEVDQSTNQSIGRSIGKSVNQSINLTHKTMMQINRFLELNKQHSVCLFFSTLLIFRACRIKAMNG